ncbi:transcriptional regulator [Galbitalea soli]|uniref:Transcriptional regulator n=1 Tax=Galbitalea soli TaxID=1268042 RepID=A0A7C9TQR1_9MICO|nr:transcriptional regulator [Galbitalea soli]NEM90862.1 transcriptional regulator [Galbitalea soli]NYJ31582.1 hypothetical protein [Galbitalea soli]
MTVTPARRLRLLVAAPTITAIGLWCIAIVILGTQFVGATQDARSATSDATFPRMALGLPILEGFRIGAHFGVHLHWGVLVFLVVPLIVALAVAALALRGMRRSAP